MCWLCKAVVLVIRISYVYFFFFFLNTRHIFMVSVYLLCYKLPWASPVEDKLKFRMWIHVMSLPVTLLKKGKYREVKRMRGVSWIWLFANTAKSREWEVFHGFGCWHIVLLSTALFAHHSVHRSVCTSFYPPLCLHIVLLATVLLSFSACLSPVSLNHLRSQCTAFAGAHTWTCVKRYRVCSKSQENSILYRLWKAMASQHHLKGEQAVKWASPKT